MLGGTFMASKVTPDVTGADGVAAKVEEESHGLRRTVLMQTSAMSPSAPGQPSNPCDIQTLASSSAPRARRVVFCASVSPVT